MKAVENKPIIVKYASKRLRNDLDIGLLVMNKNKKCYSFLEPELQENEKIQEIKMRKITKKQKRFLTISAFFDIINK